MLWLELGDNISETFHFRFRHRLPIRTPWDRTESRLGGPERGRGTHRADRSLEARPPKKVASPPPTPAIDWPSAASPDSAACSAFSSELPSSACACYRTDCVSI